MPAHQLAARAGALATGGVVVAAALFGTAPAALTPAPAPAAVVLTAVPTFDQSLRVLLDRYFDVGDKSLGDVFDPRNDTTLEHLLAATTVDVNGVDTPLGLSSSVNTAFDALGLNAISFGVLLPGLDASESLNGLLGTGGALESLGSTSLNDLLGNLGGLDQSIAGFVHASGIGAVTMGQIFDDLGFGPGKTMDDLLGALGWDGNWQRLEGFFPMLGLSDSMGAIDGVDKLTGGAISATTTLDDLLGAGGLAEKIGDMQLSHTLGIPTGETLLGLLTSLRWGDETSTDTWGDLTLAQMLGWLTLDPAKSLGENLGNLPIHLDGSTDLGSASLGAFLTALIPTDSLTGTADPAVTTDTTLSDYLDSLFGTGLTLDGFLGLDGVDISEWL